jgi:hypothetical protein
MIERGIGCEPLLRRRRTGPGRLATVALAVASALLSAATSALPRAWVGIDGVDAGSCARATPCRTLTYAITQVDAGGEVNVLDSGGYGEVLIDKAVTVHAAPGIVAGIVATGGPAITVNAGTNDRVALHGLTISSSATRSGIVVNSVGLVHIENCVLNGPGSADGDPFGIRMAAPAPAKALISDTLIRNYLHGVVATNAELDRVRSLGNLGDGIRVVTGGRVVVARSTLSGNQASGAYGYSTTNGATTVLVVEDTLLTRNGVGAFGYTSESGGTTRLTLSNNTIADNVTGVWGYSNSDSTVELTLSGNMIAANSTGVVVAMNSTIGVAVTVARTRQNNTLAFNGSDVVGTLTPLSPM